MYKKRVLMSVLVGVAALVAVLVLAPVIQMVFAPLLLLFVLVSAGLVVYWLMTLVGLVPRRK